MPYMKLQSSVGIQKPEELMKRASGFLSEQLGKPESYIMVALEPATSMAFAGSAEPCAYVELKSIGLRSDRTTELSGAVCKFIGAELGIPAGRVYIEFSGVPADMWGWDNRTFG